jgi:dihydropyrimidinase
MAATLIKNGRIVTAVDDYTADVLMVDGRIQTIGKSILRGADVKSRRDQSCRDTRGVDVPHRLQLRVGATVDTFGTGTKAAAFRDDHTHRLCNQPRGKSPLVGIEDWHKRRASACVDVGAHMIMLDVNDQSLADMRRSSAGRA